jgi:hypothetical protein
MGSCGGDTAIPALTAEVPGVGRLILVLVAVAVIFLIGMAIGRRKRP